MDEDVENVEYLDECVADDVVEVSGYSTSQQQNGVEGATFEDTFYRNAIQCLIALYRDKYDKHMSNPQEICKIRNSIWEDISKDMRESYFEFNADQVRHKFTQLRHQYFEVASRSAIGKFEYFQPCHEIYNDKIINSYLSSERPTTDDAKQSNMPRNYRDDILFTPMSKLEMYDGLDNQKETDEIAHKEHEFMVMVERELQTVENSNIGKLEIKSELPTNKRERQELKEVKVPSSPSSKRRKVGEPTPLEINKQNSVEIPDNIEQSESQQNSKGDMTLAAYNEAQQQRHVEKMELLRQTLLLQERAIEIQGKLLEQIVKRVK